MAHKRQNKVEGWTSIIWDAEGTLTTSVAAIIIIGVLITGILLIFPKIFPAPADSRAPLPDAPEIAKGYITPNNPVVQSTLSDILNNKPWYRTDYGAIQEWITNNIHYVPDSAVHGKAEYFQYPSETISLKTGDCEDFAILFCTLLRANGASPDTVYVVVGFGSSGGHAWVAESNRYGRWRYVEPQSDGSWLFHEDEAAASSYVYKYPDRCYFNDQYFTENESFAMPTNVVNTTLALNTPSSSVVQGASVTFTGRLTRGDTGGGMPDATIKIYDSDPDFDDLIVSGTTDSDGYFSISWTATPTDWYDSTVEAYAKFDGTGTFKASTSYQYTISVTGSAKTGTTLTLNTPPSSVVENETVTFTGRLTRNDTGAGVSSATIKVYDSDPDFDDLVTSGTTDSNGYFSISWAAEPKDWYDQTVEVFVKFDGSTELESSTSSQYTITVTEKTTTTLSLYASKSSASTGENVVFSGYLTRSDTGAGVSDATIKIYDSDGGVSGDDLMASGTTNSSGYYSITWTVQKMDWWDSSVEVYAKFDGTSQFEGTQTIVYSFTIA